MTPKWTNPKVMSPVPPPIRNSKGLKLKSIKNWK